MNIKVWTPKYIINKSRVLIYRKRNPDIPWLTKDAIEFLNMHLKKTDVGLEFGAGKSTAWFAKRVRHITSIETNQHWYDKVTTMLKEQSLSNVRLILNPTDPTEAYLDGIESIEKESLDFVLVDGVSHQRHHATSSAIPLIKKGGILIIDNVDWFIKSPYFGYSPSSTEITKPEWESIEKELSGWKTFWTTNGVSETAFWFKPCEIGT
jgi:predicted O-methyltransferase YrrM